jgi:hypothetical protein
MKHLNIVVEGSSEELFVNDVLRGHFAPFNIFVSARKIRTGWDRINNKPSKEGLLKYIQFRNDVVRWIQSDRNQANFWYTSLIDLYAFPKDNSSPYTDEIKTINDPYQKIKILELAIAKDINHPRFIPYVQLHEFESFLMVEPDRLLTMFPDKQTAIIKLKDNIKNLNPEEINESPQSAPSKRIIKFIPDYEGQKAQVGPLVAQDKGLSQLRNNCPHFNEWIIKLESL